MRTKKRVLIVGGLAVVLAVPAGVAVAAAASPTPAAAGAGPGSGRMLGGGDPADCPYHNSVQAQQWRAQRADRQQLPAAERQQLAQQHRRQMWAQMTGTTPPP
jgi:Spy/CpxP family protein refolding chaperone